MKSTILIMLGLALNSCAQLSKPEAVPIIVQQAHANYCKTLGLP